MDGLKPLPNKIGDLDQSLSIPVANVEVGLSGTYHIGPPDCFIDLDVPEWAKHQYIYFSDTVAVDFYRIYENSNDITVLTFNINIWNEFPVKATANIHFTNSSGEMLYKFEPIEIEDGDILFNGNIVRPGYSRSFVVFDKPTIENLRTAEILVVHLRINIKDGNTNGFKYYDEFKMNCHLGARIDYILKDI